MDFSVDEMTRRLNTVRARMEEAGVDCLFISGLENFTYFVGAPASLYQSRRPWCALIPLKAEPVAVMRGPAASALTLQRNGFFRRVETYAFPVADHMPAVVADLIKEVGTRRLACELGLEMRIGLPLADFNAVIALLPEVEIVDASSLIWSLRMTKSAEEVARLRKACEITGNTRQEVFRQVRRGMTETDVAALWAELMHQAGGERPSFIYINTGEIPDLLPTPTKKLQPGETLWLDGGVYVGGYTCDFSRIATLGPPSPRQIQLHRDVVEVFDVVYERIRPGVAVADLALLARRELELRGHSAGPVAGHSMGMLINEPPLMAPWTNLVLSEGLVIGVEFGPSQPEGFFVLEQLIQVTNDGFDLLTTEPMSLVALPDF